MRRNRKAGRRWCLDTNGNGKRDAYLDSEQKVLTAPSGESLGTSAALSGPMPIRPGTRG